MVYQIHLLGSRGTLRVPILNVFCPPSRVSRVVIYLHTRLLLTSSQDDRQPGRVLRPTEQDHP